MPSLPSPLPEDTGQDMRPLDGFSGDLRGDMPGSEPAVLSRGGAGTDTRWVDELAEGDERGALEAFREFYDSASSREV